MPSLCALGLKVLLLIIVSGQIRLDRPLPVAGTDGTYQYDDGVAYWLTWTGTCRGTWFDTGDFGGGDHFVINQLQLWFYHHSYYPWDVASFYAELWNGGSGGPAVQLEQTSLTALHYAPTYANYWPPIQTEADMWVVANTQMSGGGWPSTLGDNTPQAVSHSFHAGPLFDWEPWIVQGPTANDYFIRAMYPVSLQPGTWGSIKALF